MTYKLIEFKLLDTSNNSEYDVCGKTLLVYSNEITEYFE